MATNYLPGADMERFLKDAMQFVGFGDDDVAVIRRTGHLVLAKEQALTGALYDHFLSMPDSARFFLAEDGTPDRTRLERRKHSLGKWLKQTAEAAITPDFSYYVLMIGLSHSHRAQGPDRPGGTVPARMMVGAMSLTQSALAGIFAAELPPAEAMAASISWNKLLLVQLNALLLGYLPTGVSGSSSRGALTSKGASMSDPKRLSMPVGEAMFSQRSIRKFKSDPISMEDINLIIDAASKAPNGGNRQVGRFLVLTDRKKIHDEFGPLYYEAWWAKRRDEGHTWTSLEQIPAEEKNHRAAAQLANEMRDAPVVVFALAINNGPANSVVPACQNLMLAARTLGIGSLPTTLHPTVMDRFRAMFKIPADVAFHFCIPLGYPRGTFGPNVRKPTAETTFLGEWGKPVPWK